MIKSRDIFIVKKFSSQFVENFLYRQIRYGLQMVMAFLLMLACFNRLIAITYASQSTTSFTGTITGIYQSEDGQIHHYVDFLGIDTCADYWVVLGPLSPDLWIEPTNCLGSLRAYFSWPDDLDSPYPAHAWRLYAIEQNDVQARFT